MSDLLPEVRRLMSEGKGERVIGKVLNIGRHKARTLMLSLAVEDAKQGNTAATMPAVLSNDPDAWALLINGAFRRSYDSVIEAGRLLIEAKEKLSPHGTWLSLLETKLDFSPDTAQRLMAIARDQRLTNTAHVRFLPRSYSTLHELTKLSDEQFAHGIEAKIISPDMERKDVDRLRPRPERSSDESGSRAIDDPRPHGESLQQGLDTSSIPGTAASPHGEGAGAASVANPERQTGAPDGLPVSPGPSEPAQMPGGGLAIAHSRIEPADSLDYFPTPLWATRALFEHVLKHLGRKSHCQFQRAWEPACGEGHMADVMCEYFREVMASDIGDYAYRHFGIDFLSQDTEAPGTYDWIITNPPFNDSADFVLKAVELAGTGVAMFVRLSWLESVKRYERIFRDKPPTLIAIFSERVPLHKGRWESDGSTMTAYVWLVWLKGAEPLAPFWIPPGCRVALTKPDDAARFGAAEAAE